MTDSRLDEELTLLADRRRRRVITRLRSDESDETTVRHIVDYLQAVESDADPERIAVELHHSHLPKLQATGVIEFDRHSGAVRYGRIRASNRFSTHSRRTRQWSTPPQRRPSNHTPGDR